MKQTLLFVLSTSVAFALPCWEQTDFEKAESLPKGAPIMQYDVGSVRGNWQTWSYIHELCHTAAFVAAMQVSDSLDPEFGGIIEGEDALTVVETDNTQQAIWVWCRYYEITHDTTYFVNIRRAWIYVMNHPAYSEEGTDSDYYRVWNCGLALFAESKYRSVFNDSSYMWYADTCIDYMLAHPLPFEGIATYYMRLHPKTTSLAAGMLYQYGKEMSNQVWMDTALAYGTRVREWIESDPGTNINDEIWAMSGGTAVWGLCRSIFDADSALGITWLNTYIPYMKYYQPTGTWNNSWNIWYAHAYNFSARITQNGTYVDYHHSLTDSLRIQDRDDDGGVPPTSSWNQNQDHSWVSNYTVFMGIEGLMDSIRDYDAGVKNICMKGPRDFVLVGDTLLVAIVAANYGFSSLTNVPLEMTGAYTADTVVDLDIGVEDTVWFDVQWVPPDTGYFDFTAYNNIAGDERVENDTFIRSLYVRPLRVVSGSLVDTVLNTGIAASLYFQFLDDSGDAYFDSAKTDSITGAFTIYLIDSLYRAFIYTDIPYKDSVEPLVYVTPDSISNLDYSFGPTDLLIVNRDDSARYAEYYTEPLDTLGITYKVWAPLNQGVFPISRIDEFNTNTIIWFTGNAELNTVTTGEQESLMVFLDSGGKLLISGQNIGEEITGTQFYADYLHAQLIDDSLAALKCFPDSSDSLGQYCGKLFTTGTTGARNQYSRDVIAANGSAHEFLYYDSSLTQCAAVWYNDETNHYQTIYYAFGIEAIHKPAWPGYISRKELLTQCLDWFGVLAVHEIPGGAVQPLITVYPNPARGHIVLAFGRRLLNELGSVKVYDITGRLIRVVAETKPLATAMWDLRDLHDRCVASGIYFIRVETAHDEIVTKAVVVR